MSEAFIGDIRIFSFGFPPRGWALCDGQLLPINLNQALFSILGTTYGGNGVTTFALPNLKGRVPVSFGPAQQGLSTYVLGQVGGESAHTLSVNEIPTHNHTMSASTLTPNQPSAAGGVWADSPNAYNAGTPNTFMSPGSLIPAGGQPHENMSPFLVLNFSICLVGLFPSQN